MIISLRQSLTRTLFAIGIWLASGTAGAQAQDGVADVSPAASSDVIETVVAVVFGLSSDDLLNVRATASPIGLVLARIPNGTIVTRLECSVSRNAEWCRIEVPELDGLVGWAPARYLLSPSDDEAAAEAPAVPPGRTVVDPSQITVGILPDPLPMPEDPLADAVPATTGGAELQTALLAPAPVGPPTFDVAREAARIDGAAAELALAFATRTDPASSEVYSAFGSDAAPGAEGAEAPAEAALAVPVPSPRPPRADEPAPGAAPGPTVAALPSPDAAAMQAADAAPVRQDAAADGEPEAPEASAPDAPAPAGDAAPAPSGGPETASTAAVLPEMRADPLSARAPAVALALPSDVPGDLAAASAAVPEPADAGTTTATAASPAAEPAARPDAAGEAPRTLREQLAALLPAWSRPPAETTAGPAPERAPDAAGPAGVPAAPTLPSEGEDEADAPSVRPGDPAGAAAATEPTAPAAEAGPAPSEDRSEPAAAPSEGAASTVAGPAEPPAAATTAGTVSSGDGANAASLRPEGATERVAAVATAEPPAPAVVPAPVPVVPEPTAGPRPVETIAQAQPAQPDPAPEGETAEIPCARYVGQPMTRCAVRILRLAAEDADVTVLWPDGGERLIRFRGGEPDGTSGRGEFRFTREAELNLIRIGSGERFEILDALPFGE